MTKRIIKTGKVVVVLSGKYAGRKGFVVKTFDKGSEGRKYAHAIIAGIDRYPRKITKTMGKAKTAKRTKMTSFIKPINYNHIMPTRYQVTFNVDKIENIDKPETRGEAKKSLTTFFRKTYLEQGSEKDVKPGVSYFFKKLRF